MKRWGQLRMNEDEFVSNEGLSPLRIEAIIARNRNHFKTMTGIPFTQQQFVHDVLENLIASGHQSMDELLHSLSPEWRRNGAASADEL